MSTICVHVRMWDTSCRLANAGRTCTRSSMTGLFFARCYHISCVNNTLCYHMCYKSYNQKYVTHCLIKIFSWSTSQLLKQLTNGWVVFWSYWSNLFENVINHHHPISRCWRSSLLPENMKRLIMVDYHQVINLGNSLPPFERHENITLAVQV